jgi:hypothetical protein
VPHHSLNLPQKRRKASLATPLHSSLRAPHSFSPRLPPSPTTTQLFSIFFVRRETRVTQANGRNGRNPQAERFESSICLLARLSPSFARQPCGIRCPWSTSDLIRATPDRHPLPESKANCGVLPPPRLNAKPDDGAFNILSRANFGQFWRFSVQEIRSTARCWSNTSRPISPITGTAGTRSTGTGSSALFHPPHAILSVANHGAFTRRE